MTKTKTKNAKKEAQMSQSYTAYPKKRLGVKKHLAVHGFDRAFTLEPYCPNAHDTYIKSMAEYAPYAEEIAITQGLDVTQTGVNYRAERAHYSLSPNIVITFGEFHMARVNNGDAFYEGESILTRVGEYDRRAHPTIHSRVKGWGATCASSGEVLGFGMTPAQALLNADSNLLNRYASVNNEYLSFSARGLHPYYQINLKTRGETEPEIVYVHQDTCDMGEVINTAGVDPERVESLEVNYGFGVVLFGRLYFYANPSDGVTALINCLFPEGTH